MVQISSEREGGISGSALRSSRRLREGVLRGLMAEDRIPTDDQRGKEIGCDVTRPHVGDNAELSQMIDCGNEEDDASHYKDHGERVAADHPFAMLRDLASTDTVERNRGGDQPPARLNYRRHEEDGRALDDSNQYRDGCGDEDATDVDAARDAVKLQVARSEPI